MSLTKMWKIKEAPQYEIERTPGAWIIWGPCCSDEDCNDCGGEGSKVLDFCNVKEDGTPADRDMIKRITGLDSWIPVIIQ